MGFQEAEGQMTPAEIIAYKKRRAANPVRYRVMNYAWYLTEKAIRKGVLQPPHRYLCVDCHGIAQTYDHRFYTRPLDVVPVCRSCNWQRKSAYDLDMICADTY